MCSTMRIAFLGGWLPLFFLTVGSGLSQSAWPPRLAPALVYEKTLPKTVRLHTTDSSRLTAWLSDSHLSTKRLSKNLYEVNTVTPASWEALKKLPFISFIDVGARQAREESLLGAFDFSLNGVRRVQSTYPTVNGQGITISIKEKPYDQNDLDLVNRSYDNGLFDEPATAHATFMATIAAGGGNTSPIARGAAWGSTITTSDFAELLPDNGSTLMASGVSVQNHSYGVGLENYYGVEAVAYDQHGIDHPTILHVFSAGNQGAANPTTGTYAGITGFANLTGQFKVSKNTLTVGSASLVGQPVAQSSRGPAHDGRVKPELIAYGDAGSSESAAVVSGVAAVLQQAFKNKFGYLPEAALVKALLLNSADDVGRPEIDFESGFGNVNAFGALQSLVANQFFSGTISANGELQTHQIIVPASVDLLKVTLVWADPPGQPMADKALVNDLDLELHEGSNTWLPWILNTSANLPALTAPSQRGIDRLNNVEQISVHQPTSGTYDIIVKGFALGSPSQGYHIAYETRSGFEWVFPSQADALEANTEKVVRWRWSGNAATASLSYRVYPDGAWIVLDEVAVQQQHYNWTTPSPSGLYQLRMNVEGSDILTTPFAISIPERIKVGFNCDDELMLLWAQDSQATSYTLFSMGNQYLEPLLNTTDTFAILNKSQLSSNFFSVSPSFGSAKGLAELTIDFNTQGTGCYFIRFSPRSYLVSTVPEFDIVLGTTFNLQSATLQRLGPGGFTVVSGITPSSNSFSMTDPAPLSGEQTYRVQLVTASGTSSYSQEEQVLYLTDEELIVYPNPLRGDEEVSLVFNSEEEARVELLNMQGGLVSEVTDLGVEKTVATEGLGNGAYLVRVTTAGGRQWVKRLWIIK